ncbi:MAG TPA: cell division ATP-binding protein FtsE [Pelomicrobium sp.]|nr:cell division ATP-binding protein FtsE [Pelomicrobium sp.]
MISLSHVSKRYPGGFEALRNVTLAVDAGELVYVTGHSGAGKTTLLKLVAVIERPSGGSIVVKGQNVSKLRQAAVPYLRRHLGLVFQDQKLLFDRSVFENVMLPLEIAGFDRREGARPARAALDKVGLLQRERANPIQLSGGEQQRLAIARAVVNRPSSLLADEPTGHLDTEYAHEIMNVFTAFNQVGVTVMIATHDEAILGSHRGRIVALRQGALAA